MAEGEFAKSARYRGGWNLGLSKWRISSAVINITSFGPAGFRHTLIDLKLPESISGAFSPKTPEAPRHDYAARRATWLGNSFGRTHDFGGRSLIKAETDAQGIKATQDH